MSLFEGFYIMRGYRGVNMSLFEGFDYEILKGIIYEKRLFKKGVMSNTMRHYNMLDIFRQQLYL